MENSEAGINRNKIKTVSSQRKQALLLEARRDRVEWVDSASCPYHSGYYAPNNNSFINNSEKEDGNVMNNGINGVTLLTKHPILSTEFKSSQQVVMNLYADSMSTNEMGKRIMSMLNSALSSEDAKTVLKQVEDEQHNMVDSQSKNITFESAYETFIARMRSPEAADLVKGLRHFVSMYENRYSLRNNKEDGEKQDLKGNIHHFNVSALTQTNNIIDARTKTDDNSNTIARAASQSLHSYLKTMKGSLKSNVHWSNDSEEEFELSFRSLEVFVYQKCHKINADILFEEGLDSNFDERLEELQFVSGSHLDIEIVNVDSSSEHSIEDDEGKDPSKEENLPKWLSNIINLVNSIGSMWSPNLMLSRMRDVMNTIATLVEQNSPSENPGGADALLPILILAILKGQPKSFLSMLSFLDYFASGNELRGDTAYALVQFHSAARFILQMDSTSLTIDSKDFDKELTKAKERLEKKRCLNEEERKKYEDSDSLSADENFNRKLPPNFNVPVDAIYKRLQNNSRVDLEWAMQYYESSTSTELQSGSIDAAKDNDHPESLSLVSLPPNFSRSYNYLGLGSNEIRINDIPGLLSEYKTLVTTCEILLKERNEVQRREEKLKIQMKRDELYNMKEDQNRDAELRQVRSEDSTVSLKFDHV